MLPLSCSRLSCIRRNWLSGIAAVRNVTVSFPAGLVYGICGGTGSGKELLLYLLGLLDRPDSGTVSVLGKDISQWNQPDLARERNSLFGYLFRQPCLLPSFSVAENIAMPLLRIRGVSAEEAARRTRSLLKFCDLPDLEDLPVCQLNGMLQQQIAFIRALVHRPKILIAISPLLFFAVLPLARLAANEMGITIICTAEDENLLMTHCDRLFMMKNGVLHERNPTAA